MLQNVEEKTYFFKIDVFEVDIDTFQNKNVNILRVALLLNYTLNHPTEKEHIFTYTYNRHCAFHP